MSIIASASKKGTGILDEAQRLLDQLVNLKSEVETLRQQREDLHRFLDVDAEKAELERLKVEQADVIAKAQPQADAIIAAAVTEAARFEREAKAEATRVCADTMQAASQEAETLQREVRQASASIREAAERMLNEARTSSRAMQAEAERLAEASAVQAQEAKHLMAETDAATERLTAQRLEFDREVARIRAMMAPLRRALVDLG